MSYIKAEPEQNTLVNNNSNSDSQYLYKRKVKNILDDHLFINSNQDAHPTKKIYKKKRKSQIFTKSEDRLIITLVKKIGPKFNIISQQFHNKTLNMVKNRFYKVLRYQETEKTTQDVSQNNIQESLENSKFCPEIKEIMNKFLQDFQFFRLSV